MRELTEKEKMEPWGIFIITDKKENEYHQRKKKTEGLRHRRKTRMLLQRDHQGGKVSSVGNFLVVVKRKVKYIPETP